MNYWQQRQLEQQQKLHDQGSKKINTQLAKYYRQAIKDTQADVERLYLELMEESANGNIKTNDLYRFNRYYDLKNNLNKRLTNLGIKTNALYDAEFALFYNKVYEKIGHEYNFSFVPSVEVNNIIQSVWCADGKHYSQRVWGDMGKLQNSVEKGLMDCVARGVPRSAWRNSIISSFGTTFSNAERITRTELAYVQTMASAERYQKAGCQYYEILSDQADDDCAKYNGKRFRYSDMVVGENCCPFHPNCRCCILPVIEEV